jgi:predicted nuclease with RNAse H fold
VAKVVGVDIAGEKKGHHGVLLDVDTGVFGPSWAWKDEREALECLTSLEGLRAVGIDVPPRAVRSTEATRLAERELHRRGIRVQWTRAPGQEPLGWMVNGERLWRALEEGLPGVALVETFPTAVAVLGTDGCPFLPARLFAGELGRSRFDFLDAALAAWAAAKHLQGTAMVAGRGCPDGEIVY